MRSLVSNSIYAKRDRNGPPSANQVASEHQPRCSHAVCTLRVLKDALGDLWGHAKAHSQGWYTQRFKLFKGCSGSVIRRDSTRCTPFRDCARTALSSFLGLSVSQIPRALSSRTCKNLPSIHCMISDLDRNTFHLKQFNQHNFMIWVPCKHIYST